MAIVIICCFTLICVCGALSGFVMNLKGMMASNLFMAAIAWAMYLC